MRTSPTLRLRCWTSWSHIAVYNAVICHLMYCAAAVLGLLPRDGARVGRGADGGFPAQRAGRGHAHYLLREEHQSLFSVLFLSPAFTTYCVLVMPTALGHGTEVHQLLLEPEILRPLEADANQADIIYQRTTTRR